MVKLQWFQVNKFRSAKPGTRLTFNEGYNVLLGQNGTGKTTLLNLIAAAIKADFTEFKDEEFDFSYELTSGKASAIVSVRTEDRSSPIPSELEGLPSVYSGAMASAVGRRTPVLSFSARISSKHTGIGVEVNFDGSNGSIQIAGEPT